MTVYLDASVLVGLFTVDTFSLRATAFLKTQKTHPDCQRFCRRGVRFGSGPPRPNSGGHVKRAHGMFAQMDGWIAQSAKRIEIVAADVVTAQGFLRRLDLTLRTPDAINIAMTQRISASLATFDDQMRVAAAAIGVAIVSI